LHRRLAVQAMSSSVAKALKCLDELDHPQFRNTSATVEYIEVSFDGTIDVRVYIE
jgi:hypothetical protein